MDIRNNWTGYNLCGALNKRKERIHYITNTKNGQNLILY